ALRAQTFATAATPLRTGFLPTPYMVGDVKRDISAAGLEASVPSAFALKYVDRSDPERPQVRSREHRVEPTANVIRMNGAVQPASAFIDEIIDGYQTAARAVLNNRRRLLAPGGELSAFRDIEIRWVARGTAQYSTALSASHHPVHMRDGLD
ncbi:DUF4135 domain-containing protein, partial [Cronobacter sakazakii]|uniref:DUF4135 domain-containing protein n=1 Tax=Cronobacter sakazakii TaxID=28141 RepID=UPI00111BE0C5